MYIYFFFNFTAAKDDSSSDTDATDEVEATPLAGQGKPSHERRATGGSGHPRRSTRQRAKSSDSECKFFSSKLLSMYSSVEVISFVVFSNPSVVEALDMWVMCSVMQSSTLPSSSWLPTSCTVISSGLLCSAYLIIVST